MKIICSIIGILLGQQILLAQTSDSTFRKKILTTLDVATFFSAYIQEGEHSAVTGGEGTEELQVYHTGAKIAYGINAHLIIFNASIDVITSPSTDKIDYVRSSASEQDNHVQANLGYQYTFEKHRLTLGAAYSLGIESDYWSDGFSVWGNWVNKNKTRAIAWGIDCFFDDLRWGRLDSRQGYIPVELVYPVELRKTQWFDIYHRNSYNFSFNFRQDINKKFRMNVSLGTTYQEGVLSTPFHRVYFRDTTAARVESLPRKRLRLPFSISANWFARQKVVLQSYYRIYWDNFGIFAHTLNLQTAIKPSNKLSIYPFIRGYYQTGSMYFAPYGEHSLDQAFYTSDYDFSTFGSIKLGLGFGWYPDLRLGKKSKFYFNNIMIRYAFSYRSDGLSAHIISLQMGLKK